MCSHHTAWQCHGSDDHWKSIDTDNLKPTEFWELSSYPNSITDILKSSPLVNIKHDRAEAEDSSGTEDFPHDYDVKIQDRPSLRRSTQQLCQSSTISGPKIKIANSKPQQLHPLDPFTKESIDIFLAAERPSIDELLLLLRDDGGDNDEDDYALASSTAWSWPIVAADLGFQGRTISADAGAVRGTCDSFEKPSSSADEPRATQHVRPAAQYDSAGGVSASGVSASGVSADVTAATGVIATGADEMAPKASGTALAADAAIPGPMTTEPAAAIEAAADTGPAGADSAAEPPRKRRCRPASLPPPPSPSPSTASSASRRSVSPSPPAQLRRRGGHGRMTAEERRERRRMQNREAQRRFRERHPTARGCGAGAGGRMRF